MNPGRVHRLVLDANVLVSSQIRPTGTPGMLLTRCLSDASLVMVTSQAILDEFHQALRYPKVVRLTRQTPEDTGRVIAALALLSDMVEGALPMVRGCADPDDVVYVQVALAGRASFVVTGDKHLLAMDGYEGLRILTPAAMLREIG